eukprot:7090282-Prymnesium_polylepis.1
METLHRGECLMIGPDCDVGGTAASLHPALHGPEEARGGVGVVWALIFETHRACVEHGGPRRGIHSHTYRQAAEPNGGR